MLRCLSSSYETVRLFGFEFSHEIRRIYSPEHLLKRNNTKKKRLNLRLDPLES